MKKFTAGMLVGTVMLSMGLGAGTVPVLDAQHNGFQYEGESILYHMPPSVVWGMTYKKSAEANREMTKVAQFLEDLGMTEPASTTAFTAAMEQVENMVVVVAINNVDHVKFDALEDNDPNNFCVMGRMRMNQELEKELLSELEGMVSVSTTGGYTYAVTPGCATHRELNTQERHIAVLRDMANTNHVLGMYYNKEHLQRAFMKSDTYAMLKENLTPQAILEEMWLMTDDEATNKKRVQAMTLLLVTLRSLNMVEMLVDAKRGYEGVGYKDGVLTVESNVDFSKASMTALYSEISSAAARTSKLFLSEQVRVTPMSNTKGGISYNKIEYSNLDASIVVGMVLNVAMSSIMTSGAFGEFMGPSYDDYSYDEDWDWEDDMYWDEEETEEELLQEEIQAPRRLFVD